MYVIVEGKPIQGTTTRTFKVRQAWQEEFRAVEVWGHAPPRCTRCQGALVAMVTTCKHALAVKRFLKRQACQDQ